MPDLGPTLVLRGLTLRVQNLERQLRFYQGLLGLELVRREGNRVELAPAGGGFGLELVHEPSAPLRPRPTLGLYHFALLLPSRRALGEVVQHLLDARYPTFEGASDHGVSEAVYLSDPEGNGIELYRDRPRAEWPRRENRLSMGNQPLDFFGLLSEVKAPGPLDPTTRLGHIHLHVADLDEAEAFFTGLGMEVTQRDFPGARFFAADGYHHHVGVNLWAQNRLAPANATGLLGYRIALLGRGPETLQDPNGAWVRLEPL
ncbi:Catechol-2,3-dioxygenase [Meiothermus luteus]|jgi:catechol 2,3-dioxygenase|uniref:Catechol-2,3-dioxygenase n=1 Tax=Meiothermus luteus TaxID=2026184 RepID=A0A399EW99_9DEIN|nr:VOC family protein [Meiothermus luteus]RIH87716.1 Catechol-2,3-dioxygenase [Meiothermus luteus]RMH53699.1 MAG: glyoxalase [Deinococcota bacterium]